MNDTAKTNPIFPQTLEPISYGKNLPGNDPFLDHNHDGLNSKLIAGSGGGLGSFPGSSIATGQILTTDATPTTKTLFTFNLANQVAIVDGYCTARRTAGSAGSTGDSGGFIRSGTIKRFSSGSPSIMTMVQDRHTHRDQSDWNVDFIVTSTGIDIQVQGTNDNNITWDYQIFIMFSL